MFWEPSKNWLTWSSAPARAAFEVASPDESVENAEEIPSRVLKNEVFSEGSPNSDWA